VLIAAGVTEAVAQEVHGAALPGAAEHLRDRRLQARVGVADRQLDADQAACDEPAQELGPERLGLGLADIDREDLPSPGLVNPVRDHQRLVDHAPAVADLLDLRIQEQIRVGALQRPRPERLHVLIERLADPADLALAHPQPQALDQLVHPPRRDPADVRLLHHRQQRLLRAPARLEEAREVAALTDLGDLQLDLPGPGVPPPRPIPVAMRRPILRATLAVLGADQLRHLELQHLRRHRSGRLADHIGVLIEQHLPDDLLDRHPVGYRPSPAPPFVEPSAVQRS